MYRTSNQLKNLSEMLQGKMLNNDNLHRVAISNIQNTERRLIRWWCNRYKQPPKPLEEYTLEELMIEQLEEYYINNPEKIDEFKGLVDSSVDDWDGTISPELEEMIRSKANKVDISKYQTENDKNLSDEEVEKITRSVWGLKLRDIEQDNSAISSDESDLDMEEGAIPDILLDEDAKLSVFHSEVFDSLQRGAREKVDTKNLNYCPL